MKKKKDREAYRVYRGWLRMGRLQAKHHSTPYLRKELERLRSWEDEDPKLTDREKARVEAFQAELLYRAGEGLEQGHVPGGEAEAPEK